MKWKKKKMQGQNLIKKLVLNRKWPENNLPYNSLSEYNQSLNFEFIFVLHSIELNFSSWGFAIAHRIRGQWLDRIVTECRMNSCVKWCHEHNLCWRCLLCMLYFCLGHEQSFRYHRATTILKMLIYYIVEVKIWIIIHIWRDIYCLHRIVSLGTNQVNLSMT